MYIFIKKKFIVNIPVAKVVFWYKEVYMTAYMLMKLSRFKIYQNFSKIKYLYNLHTEYIVYNIMKAVENTRKIHF